MQTLLPAVLLLFLVFSGVEASSPQGTGEYGTTVRLLLDWAEYAGILAVGWGTGVVGWLATAHQTGAFLFFNVPRSWRLWRRGVFTSLLPLFKYLMGGVFLLALGVVLAPKLMGFWTEAFDLGLWAGGATGMFWSVTKLWTPPSQVDFLLSNRRHVDESKVPIFANDDS